MADELNLHRDTVNRWVISYKEKGGERPCESLRSGFPQSKNGIKKFGSWRGD